MSYAGSVTPDIVAQLCPACGLCCNGVLFADVELQRKDNPLQLASLGFELLAKGRRKAFAQPCVCFDGQWCRAYDQRPVRCRTFECQVLRRRAQGEITQKAALKLIRDTQSKVRQIKASLRRLGNKEECLPLVQRYGQVMAQPLDLSASQRFIKLRTELMRAMDQLMATLQRSFLT